MSPLWSADSQAIFFVDGTRLRRLDLAGGSPQAVLDLPCNPTGGTWADGGATLLFGCRGMAGEAGVYRIPIGGGAAVRLIRSATGRLDFSHVVRSVLPDRRHFLYLRVPMGGEDRGRSQDVFLDALDLEPEQQPGEPILQSEYAPVYVAQDDPEGRVPGDGYLLFSRDGVLRSRPFDSTGLALVGNEAPLTVGSSGGAVTEFAGPATARSASLRTGATSACRAWTMTAPMCGSSIRSARCSGA